MYCAYNSTRQISTNIIMHCFLWQLPEFGINYQIIKKKEKIEGPTPFKIINYLFQWNNYATPICPSVIFSLKYVSKKYTLCLKPIRFCSSFIYKYAVTVGCPSLVWKCPWPLNVDDWCCQVFPWPGKTLQWIDCSCDGLATFLR